MKRGRQGGPLSSVESQAKWDGQRRHWAALIRDANRSWSEEKIQELAQLLAPHYCVGDVNVPSQAQAIYDTLDRYDTDLSGINRLLAHLCPPQVLQKVPAHLELCEQEFWSRGFPHQLGRF